MNLIGQCPEFVRLLRAAMRAFTGPGSDFTGTVLIRVHIHRGSPAAVGIGYEERATKFDTEEVVTLKAK